MVSSPKSKRSVGRKEIKINSRGKSVSEIATSDGDISMMQKAPKLKPMNCISPTIQRPNFDINKLNKQVARSSNMSERRVEKRETQPMTDRNKEDIMNHPSQNHPAYTRRASQVI